MVEWLGFHSIYVGFFYWQSCFVLTFSRALFINYPGDVSTHARYMSNHHCAVKHKTFMPWYKYRRLFISSPLVIIVKRCLTFRSIEPSYKNITFV